MAHKLDVLGLFDNNYRDDGFRTCSVTGLEIHRSVGAYLVKLFGLGGRRPAVRRHLRHHRRDDPLGSDRAARPSDFYTHLSMHAWNLLIFWMVFMEIAIPLRGRADGSRPPAAVYEALRRPAGS